MILVVDLNTLLTAVGEGGSPSKLVALEEDDRITLFRRLDDWTLKAVYEKQGEEEALLFKETYLKHALFVQAVEDEEQVEMRLLADVAGQVNVIRSLLEDVREEVYGRWLSQATSET